MTGTMTRARHDEAAAARTYLHLSRLLDDVEREHPAVSASLRLTLVRSRRRYDAGWLDAERFQDVLLELTSLAGSAAEVNSGRTPAPGAPAGPASRSTLEP